jgi:hypothetical protein
MTCNVNGCVLGHCPSGRGCVDVALTLQAAVTASLLAASMEQNGLRCRTHCYTE